MKQVNTKVWIITIIAISLLCGFVIIQAQILNRSIQVNRQIFHQRMDVLSNNIGESFRKNEDAALSLPVWIAGDSANRINAVMNEIIEEELRNNNLKINFTYGLYVHSLSDHKLMERAWGMTTRTVLDLRDGDSIDSADDFIQTPLTCGNSYGDENEYHLAIFIDDDFYVLSEAGSAIAISLLFVCCIVVSISFLIHVIRKQKRVSELKDDFINNLTHEFKTPIFTIDLANGILRSASAVRNSDKLARYCDVIADETERLKMQVDNVLQMSLVDSGNFQLEKVPTDIHEMLRKVAANFDLLIAEKGGKILLDFKSQVRIVKVDALHLRNAFSNLVDNAIKYNTSSDPLIIIETYDSMEGLAVCIKDNGVGMDGETKRFIFQRFYRAHHHRLGGIKGFGLGLSYVKQIVDAHKCGIKLFTQINYGSEFTILFPANG
jgi:two-component system, OmpR family, phosphate regulon sensor histidine kinase PhoR